MFRNVFLMSHNAIQQCVYCLGRKRNNCTSREAMREEKVPKAVFQGRGKIGRQRQPKKNAVHIE